MDRGKPMKLICRIIGHNIEGQPIKPVGSTMGTKMVDEFGMPLAHPIAYHMRVCKRCGREQPISEDDAQRRKVIMDEINRVMNGARAQYGLGWHDFGDRDRRY